MLDNDIVCNDSWSFMSVEKEIFLLNITISFESGSFKAFDTYSKHWNH